MSKIENGGLDQYGAGPFGQQQFRTADIEGVDVCKRLAISKMAAKCFPAD